MKKILKILLIVLIVAVIGIQFFPVNQENPPVSREVEITPAAKTILERSCYDCHSNQTVWPWYSHVAPVSWIIADHVKEGREHLNFSEWDKYDVSKQQKNLEEIIEEIEKEKMPIKGYLIIHRDANISENDLKQLRNWVNTMQAKLEQGN